MEKCLIQQNVRIAISASLTLAYISFLPPKKEEAEETKEEHNGWWMNTEEINNLILNCSKEFFI